MNMWQHAQRQLVKRLITEAARLTVAAALSEGRRASVAWCTDAFFVAMADEFERQGVTRKVAAQLFGLTRRTYNRRLADIQSPNLDDLTLTSRILVELGRGPKSKASLTAHFSAIPLRTFRSVLRDLHAQGWVTEEGGVLVAKPPEAPDGDAHTAYVRAYLSVWDEHPAEELAAALEMTVEELEAIRSAREPYKVHRAQGPNLWLALGRMVAIALRAARYAIDGQSDRSKGTTLGYRLVPGDRDKLVTLRERYAALEPVFMDGLRGLETAADRTDAIGEWSVMVVQTVDLDEAAEALLDADPN